MFDKLLVNLCETMLEKGNSADVRANGRAGGRKNNNFENGKSPVATIENKIHDGACDQSRIVFLFMLVRVAGARVRNMVY